METSTVKFRAGCDPEVFLRSRSGKFISVIGRIRGNKWNPFQIPELPKGFTLQQDNVSLEFGIPPAASKEEFIKNVETVKKAGRKYLKGLSYSQASCAVFPEDQMQTAEAHMFGCEPDYNAWTGKENQKPQPPHPFMRSAGGHIHVETSLDKNEVVKAMDLVLGIPLELMDDGDERKKLYGKAGACRYKDYGVEYRTPSNWWIFDTKRIGWVWDQTAQALDLVSHGYFVTDSRVRECIDNSDKQLAKKLIKEYSLVTL